MRSVSPDRNRNQLDVPDQIPGKGEAMPTAGKSSRARQVAMRIGLRLIPVGAILASTTLIATPAHAASVTIIRSWETGLCLDSNFAGEVYTLPCNVPQNNNHQKWRTNYPSTGRTWIQNLATGLCLVTSEGNTVRTVPCDTGGFYQEWVIEPSGLDSNPDAWMAGNYATKDTLKSDRSGRVFTYYTSNPFLRNWKFGY
ncbi:ricin-type beta-trefoil lectin domain protein [Streptosporangium sp. NPDC020145]|uniref:RICIN domain-containing protein n=1 Tax=Streptosporangium sp. NPDC020145 TaxID=3154694 RepID=UPI00341C0897